jgi:hypothetical protein
MARHIFPELSPFSDVCEQVTAATNFHYKDDVLGRFERLVKFYDVIMTSSSQNIKFLHDFAF